MRVQITDLALEGITHRRLRSAGFDETRDVVETQKTDGIYATFTAHLTTKLVQIMKENNDTAFEILST